MLQHMAWKQTSVKIPQVTSGLDSHKIIWDLAVLPKTIQPSHIHTHKKHISDLEGTKKDWNKGHGINTINLPSLSHLELQ